MIVVVGNPVAVAGEANGGGAGAAGTAARAALAAAAAGSEVQLVGKVGDDAEGDAILLALARGGVAHVAVLRDPSRRTPVVDAPADEDADPFADGDEQGAQPRAGTPSAGPRPTLEAADVDLALRYIADFGCLVLAEPLANGIVRTAADAARYSAATLVVVSGSAVSSSWTLPPDALVLGPPDDDRDGVFARVLGEVAAAIDRGMSASAALADVTGRLRAGQPG